jgi:hypothetical protein
MSSTLHRVYISTMVAVVLIVTFFLAYKGASYYATPLEERFYHPDHDYFKPSGLFGHGLGIIGTLLIAFGVSIYIARKRYKLLARFGRLKYWLEFHIFLCTLGPIMVLFHTAFKFGGIVSIAFWSMVAVVASGVIGRFIYIQIPRTIEGRMLHLHEIQSMKTDLGSLLSGSYQLDPANFQQLLAYVNGPVTSGGNLMQEMITKYLSDRSMLAGVRKDLRQQGLAGKDIKHVTRLVQQELTLSNRISRLRSMQKLFRYWHVVHMPFALIMLVIVLLHIAVTVSFGATWIF